VALLGGGGIVMEFVKMHGLGNDFIVMKIPTCPQNIAELAQKWCDRHFGIGADGVVLILPSARADAMMRIFNPDGSESGQCGNAIRCVAKYLWDRSWIKGEHLTVETKGAGVQSLVVSVNNGKLSKVRVDMGEPVLQSEQIPVVHPASQVIDQYIEVDQKQFRFTAVSMGNPHCVIEVEHLEQFEVSKWGHKLEYHPWFPDRMNIEFVTIESPTKARMKVWERGSGETLACGTGACAVLVAAVLNGKMERMGTIDLPGGELTIEWNELNGRVYMTGPATEVFEGLINL
jgi:diaminopimelate epimerase